MPKEFLSEATDMIPAEVVALRSQVMKQVSHNDGQIRLTPDNWTSIEQSFERLRQGPHVKDAAQELLQLGYFFEQHGDDDGSKRLVALAETAQPELERAGEKIEHDHARAKARTFLGD